MFSFYDIWHFGEVFSALMNPGSHCTGQMADSVYGVVWVSGLLMSMLWIEWPMVAVGLWYGQEYVMDNEHSCILLMTFWIHRDTVTRFWGSQSPLFHKHIYQINSSAQVHLMHSQYVRAFWTLFAFSWSFIYPHDISNLYVLIFQVSFLNKYCKFFIHSWLSFAFVFIQFVLSEDVAPHDILQLQLPFNFSSPCQ